MPAQTFTSRLAKMTNMTVVAAYLDAQRKLGYHLANSKRETAHLTYRMNENAAATRYVRRADTLHVELRRRGLLTHDGKVLPIFTDRGTD